MFTKNPRLLLLLLAIPFVWRCSNPSVLTIRIPSGGRAVAVSFHPTDANQVLVASETGGLFKSTNGGTQWTQVSRNATFGFTDVLFLPSNPSVVIATAAEDFKTTNGGGIWRSIDGGDHWSRVPVTPPASGCVDNFSGYALSFRSSGNRVYAGTSCGLSFSDDEGATWSFVPAGTGYNNDIVYAVCTPDANRIAIRTNGAVKVSTNSGTSWSQSFTGLPGGQHWGGVHTQLVISPLNPDHIYSAFNYGGSNALYLSTNFGNSWTQVVDRGGVIRPPFVKITNSYGGNKYTIYYSDGGCLLQRAEVTHGTTPVVGAWTTLTMDHCDPADIGFGTDRVTPRLLLSDGGLHTTTNGGMNWTLSGAGASGYNALQITEVTGQLHAAGTSADLYFGTQDNYIWASPDLGNTWPNSICCEGFFLNIPRESLPADQTRVTGVACGACFNFIAGPLLTSMTGFPNPPNDNGNPFLLKPGYYVQNTRIAGLDASLFNLTTNNGSNWVPRYGFPEQPMDLSKKSGNADNPVVFTAIRVPGEVDGHEIIRIKKIMDITGDGMPLVSNVENFGSLGIFPTMFAWYKPFGVDPQNPNRIYIADVTDNKMKVTTNGGVSWRPDDALTQLVTDNGNLKFRKNNFTQVSCFGFDPDCRTHILVGTVQGGIMETFDNGLNWAKIDNSDVIPYVSSFFFPGGRKAVISSYGRGLWTYTYGDCPAVLPVKPDFKWTQPLIWWKGGYVPLDDIDNPDVCPVCGFILVEGGRIMNILTDKASSKIEEITISSGKARFYSWDKKEMQVPFKVTLSEKTGDFEIDKGLQEVVKENNPINGLYLDGNLYKGAILYDGDMNVQMLPERKTMPPHIRMDLEEGDYISAGEEKPLRFYVIGYNPQYPLEITIDNERLKSENYKQSFDDKGNIVIEVRMFFAPGAHTLRVEQKAEQEMRRDVFTFHVVIGEEEKQ